MRPLDTPGVCNFALLGLYLMYPSIFGEVFMDTNPIRTLEDRDRDRDRGRDPTSQEVPSVLICISVFP